MQGRIPTCSSAHICRTNKTFGLKTTCGEENLNQGRFGFRPLGANLLPGALPRWSTATLQPPPSQPCLFSRPTPPPSLPSTARCLYCRPQGSREAPVGFRGTEVNHCLHRLMSPGRASLPNQQNTSSGGDLLSR